MSENEAERELDKALAEYAEHFGEQYIFQIGFDFLSTEETTEEIRKLIAEGKKQTKHRYEKGVQY